MFCSVYILKCKDGSYYTGITSNRTRLTNEHNQGIKSCLQKSKILVKLVYLEKLANRILAAKREKEIKRLVEKKENSIN